MNEEVRIAKPGGYEEAASIVEKIRNHGGVHLLNITSSAGPVAGITRFFVFYAVPDLDEHLAEDWEPDRYQEANDD